MKELGWPRERQPLIDRLENLPSDAPLDRLDEQLLALWNETILNDCYDAEPWRASYESAKNRVELLIQLKTAISQKDHPLVVKLSESELLRHYPLHPEIEKSISRSVKINQNTTAILESLAANDYETFAAHFDTSILRSLECNETDKFDPYRDRATEWCRRIVGDLETIGLTVPLVRPPVAQSRNGGFDLRWNFPDMRFSDTCLLSISGATPSFGYNPLSNQNIWQTPVSRAAYEQGGGHRIVHPDRERGHFVVSAIIDLGFCELVSHPLVLGRFP